MIVAEGILRNGARFVPRSRLALAILLWLATSGLVKAENPNIRRFGLDPGHGIGTDSEFSSTQPASGKDVVSILETSENGQPAVVLICDHDASGANSLIVCSAEGQPYLVLSGGSLVMLDSTDPGAVFLLHRVRFRLKLRGSDDGLEFDLALGKIDDNPQSVIDWQPVSLARAAEAHAKAIVEYRECGVFAIETPHTRTVLRGLHKFGEVQELATVDVLSGGDALRARTVSGLRLNDLGVDKLSAQKVEQVGLRCKEAEFTDSVLKAQPLMPAQDIWSRDGVSRASATLERLIPSRKWAGETFRLSLMDELDEINLIARFVAPDAANDITSLINVRTKAAGATIQEFTNGNISFAAMMADLALQLKTDGLQKLMAVPAYVQFCSHYLVVAHGLININPLRPILALVEAAGDSMNISADQKGSIALLCVRLRQESDGMIAELLRNHPSKDEIQKISAHLTAELVQGLRDILTSKQFEQIQQKIMAASNGKEN